MSRRLYTFTDDHVTKATSCIMQSIVYDTDDCDTYQSLQDTVFMYGFPGEVFGGSVRRKILTYSPSVYSRCIAKQKISCLHCTKQWYFSILVFFARNIVLDWLVHSTVESIKRFILSYVIHEIPRRIFCTVFHCVMVKHNVLQCIRNVIGD